MDAGWFSEERFEALFDLVCIHIPTSLTPCDGKALILQGIVCQYCGDFSDGSPTRIPLTGSPYNRCMLLVYCFGESLPEEVRIHA